MAMAVIKPLQKIPSASTSVKEHRKWNVYHIPLVSVLFLQYNTVSCLSTKAFVNICFKKPLMVSLITRMYKISAA